MGEWLAQSLRTRWWIVAAIFVAMASTIAACVLPERLPSGQGSSPAIQIQSPPWQVGSGVELVLQSESFEAGQHITVTVLAPGLGDPQVKGLAPEFFGIAGVQIPWLLPEYRRTEMVLAAASGARYVGLDFDWRRLEPEPGRYDWADADEVVALAKEHDLRLVPMLLYTPAWASTAPYAPLDMHRAPPADYYAYRDFVYAVVSRYKPYGDSALTSDGYGISDWVIWNEPNLRSAGEAPEPEDFWTGSLEEYILLLRFGHEGAHAADPGSNVLNGGLADVFWSGEGLYLAEALERLYDPDGDGDASDGARPFFDTLNIHSYQPGSPDASWYQERLAAITQVMERFGDAQKAIWITETGYGTLSMPAEDSQYVDDQTQAAAVRLVYATLSAYPQVERAFWWSLRDYYHDGSKSNQGMEGHYGLLRADFGLKPAYLTYGRTTGRLGELTTLRAVTDAEGVAHVAVPASFVSQPGTYLAFARVQDHPPSSVFTFEASADRVGQN